MLGQKRPQGADLGRIADLSAVLRVGQVFERLQRRHGRRRPDQPELLRARVLVENVPPGLYVLLSREARLAPVVLRRRKEQVERGEAAGDRPFVEQVEMAGLRAIEMEAVFPPVLENLLPGGFERLLVRRAIAHSLYRQPVTELALGRGRLGGRRRLRVSRQPDGGADRYEELNDEYGQ